MALQGPEELGEQLEEPEDLDDQDASSISPAEEITLPPGLGGDEEAEEALLLPWDRFSAWLHCICVVGFDLELGQAVEVRGRTRLCKTPPRSAAVGQTGATQLCLMSCLAEQTLKIRRETRNMRQLLTPVSWRLFVFFLGWGGDCFIFSLFPLWCV